jgi:hypothetical protein
MDDKNIMYLGILGVIAVGYYLGKEEPENTFLVDGVSVPESDLPGLGYIKYNGQWFLKADVITAAQTNGVTSPGNIDINTQIGFDIFMTLLNAGLGVTTLIIGNTAQRKADLIEQIETKYTLVVSLSYDAAFPFTNTELSALTVAKLEKVLNGNFAVSGISEDNNLFYQTRCLDGNFSSANGKGACSYHGGIRGGNWMDKL